MSELSQLVAQDTNDDEDKLVDLKLLKEAIQTQVTGTYISPTSGIKYTILDNGEYIEL